MKVGKLLIFILNLALLGLLIAILIKKGKSEKFNDLELAGVLPIEPPISQQLANMELQIQNNKSAIGDLSPKSIKKLQTDVDDILKMVNPVKKTITANKVTLGKWSMSNVEENNLQDLLQFCHKGQTGVGGQINGNLVTFRPTGLGQIGQIWTGEVHAPGYLTADGKGPLAFSPCGQPLIYPTQPHVTPPPLWTQIGDNTSEIGNTNKTIDTFYSTEDGKVTLTANTLDAPNAIVDVLDMYPWTLHSSYNLAKPYPSATLNFCVRDPANLKDGNIYNPIFFKFDNSGNLGQVWANRIQSPGFIDIPNGPSAKTQWLGPSNTCPGEPPPKIGV